ncbi:MAG: dihydropyrimidinase [Alphaproteobacteria bacterium]
MADFDLVIRNARVATASDVFESDIGVKDGKVAALARGLPAGTEEVDAAGRWVLPGGVDTHCHFDQPLEPPVVMSDDFASGTVSAAHGGTTTIVPFACQQMGQSLRAAVEDYHRRAAGKPVIDYAFHIIVADPTDQVTGQEMPALVREGYTSFKIYTTYEGLKLDDRQVIRVLATARREGAMVMVHAENADCIDWITDRLLEAGQTDAFFHARSRPQAVEREGAHRAITMSEIVDCPILLVHVSSKETVEQIRWAQSKGLNIYAETCPQYLVLTDDDLDKPKFEGAKYVCSPPPRDEASRQAIWDGLSSGVFHCFSSDHSAYSFDTPDGKKAFGADADFTKIPNGLPGVETRLPLLFSEGVNTGRISINQFVALTATNPARQYGLYPRKGSIAIGADADIVIWNDKAKITMSNAMLHHNCDYTPYEGMTFTAWPEVVFSRGEKIVADGKLNARAGRGQFLECDLPAPARPSPKPMAKRPVHAAGAGGHGHAH